jgi:CPA1 family monovalent cation:H+ antiporter
MISSADLVALLFVLAAVVATLNHRFVGLPRAIAMLISSLGLSAAIALMGRFVDADLTAPLRGALDTADLPQVLLDIVLGLLLFAASLNVDLTELNRQKWVILALATAGVVIATTIFGVGIYWLFGLAGSPIPLGWCLVLGAVLAPTDAVVVEALLRHVPMPSALKTAISGESLFNDGAGVVLFQIMLGLAAGKQDLIGHGQVILAFAMQGLIGGALGCVTGDVAARFMRWDDDHAVRLMVSLALVTGTYRLASELGLSGPTAVVACGLMLRLRAPRDPLKGSIVDEISAFWSVVDALLNAMLFLLVGFELFAINFARVVVLPVAGALPLALASRLAGVVVAAGLLRVEGAERRRGVALLTWAGLRGGVSIALALTMPANPYRGRLLVICYTVVVASMLLQGLTMPWLIARLYRGRGASKTASPPADA